MPFNKYVKLAIVNIKAEPVKSGLRLLSKCSTLFLSDYYLSEDITPKLDSEGLTFYQEQIGVLWWAIEVGRVDILLEVSLLSSYLALPRIEHL